MEKKYTTEEERKAAKREYNKQYYQANKEKIAERQKQYFKQYYQTNKEKKAECYKQWYETNKEKRADYLKQYHQDNREKILEKKKQYNQTPFGRASKLVSGHNQTDAKMGRGECTLTAQWIIDNIFTQKCIYCGESDWRKLGCDRKDNSLPHTPSNVVPCCVSCNKKRGTKPFEEFLAEYKKDLESIATT